MTIALLMGQSLSFVLIAGLGLLIRRITHIDITLACLLSGIIGGLVITQFGFDIGLRAHSVEQLVFYIFLPVLIFEAAWHLNPQLLKRWFVPAFIYATLGVVIAAGVVMALTFFLMDSPQGFPLMAALLTGAILAATDPVAVVAKLTQLDAPEDLRTLFEGESLLNDATAVVLFTVVLMFATGELKEAAPTAHILYFAKVFLGGIAVGLCVGFVCQLLIVFLRDKNATIIALLVAAFGSFYLAEHSFHVSGIMAVAVAALLIHFALNRKRQIEHDDETLSVAGSSLEWLGLLFNMLIFTLMGLVLTLDMFAERWLAMLIGIAAALLARFSGVYICTALLRVMGRPMPAEWSLLLSWGGLRGAIAVALALSLPVSLPYWWTIQSMIFGVVLFTLLVQGTTFGYLLKSKISN